jgi:hypothetical protein
MRLQSSHASETPNTKNQSKDKENIKKLSGAIKAQKCLETSEPNGLNLLRLSFVARPLGGMGSDSQLARTPGLVGCVVER